MSETHCSCGVQKMCAEQPLNGELILVTDVGREGQRVACIGKVQVCCKYCEMYRF